MEISKEIIVIILLTVLLGSTRVYAQAPQRFSFQGVARDAAGMAISNATVGVRFTIHSDITIGPTVYQETHNASTGPGGIFTLQVGTGNNINGVFAEIAWGSKSYFLQVELDPTGGITYTNMGASQILSVPYALHAEEAGRWKNNDPIVQKGVQGSGPLLENIGTGPTLIWYPRKSAFRAGYISSDAWNDNTIGLNSTAFGFNTRAYGFGSFAAGEETQALLPEAVAMGKFSIASGTASFAIGEYSKTNGVASIAMGISSESLGDGAFAAGERTVAKSRGSASLGCLNDDSDNPIGTVFQWSDRIFQIGNGGIPLESRSNALTVLRNGNVGIGNNALIPQFILDIGARARIRHNPGVSAGLYFDDSNGSPECFVGMKGNGEVGFFNGGKWAFWADDLGNAHITGTNYNTSDKRLKRDFSSLSNSLTKLSDLDGYHYFWKDSTLDQSLQTGLIAQEVEAIFPELVKTDDQGFKSVNYTGLIPHLIESVKELKASIEYLQTLNTSIKSQNEELKAQATEIASFREELKALQTGHKSMTDKVETAPFKH